MGKSGTMKDIPDAERPYEKCIRNGVSALSDAELFAVLLRSGTKGENVLELANRLLYGGEEAGLSRLHSLTMAQLLKIRGIGKVKAVQVLCLAELAKRMSKASAGPSLCFTSPQSIAKYYMEEMRHEKQEMIKLVMLNSKNHFLGDTMIAKGTVNMTVISPREVLIEAMHREAVSIVLLHNHPSGDPTPSEADLLLTKRLKASADIVGIALLDHIIIGDRRYRSFSEDGRLGCGP